MVFNQKILIVFIQFSCLVLLMGCGGDSNSNTDANINNTPPVSVPYAYNVPLSKSDGWAVGHLNDVNVEESLIVSMMNAVESDAFVNIDGIFIVRNNTLVLDELLRNTLSQTDRYFSNTNPEVHTMQSVTKSFTSALVGIAIDKGYIENVDVGYYSLFTEYPSFDNWDSRKAAMTVENVLTMRHGWDYKELDGNSLAYINNNFVDFAKALLDFPMANSPGTTFAYSTIASVTLGLAVENASGVSLENFAAEHLFAPLGITSYWWFITGAGHAHTGGGLWMKGRDMIKFGQLYLNKGNWNGDQLISEDWVTWSTQKWLELNYTFADGYGYQWWHQSFDIPSEGVIDTYFAAGNGGQFIYVVPSKNAVIGFTGDNLDDGELTYQPVSLMRDFILPALVD
jgi:CubicO group peptidase (beta-lactamase class C family)